MKIVIAAWHIRDFNVGLSRYCRNFIDALGNIDSGHHYEILIPITDHHLPRLPNIKYRVVQFPLFKRRLWEQVAPLMVGPYDILHFPYDSSVLWKRGKFIVTIHDIKPLLFPELRNTRNMNHLIQRLLVPEWECQADQIVTISQSSKNDLIQRLNIPQDRISVIPQGVDIKRFRPLSMNRQREENDRPFLLTVCGNDPSKNPEAYLQAFVRLPRSIRDMHDLVLAGDLENRRDLRQMVKELDLESQAKFLGIVSDDQLVDLYRRAAVFVFPSKYEGFGLPVLEAMASGCPVLCSNTSSLPEVAGESGLLFDPENWSELAALMERVLSDHSLREQMKKSGIERAEQFSWERTARETVKVYEKIGRDSP